MGANLVDLRETHGPHHEELRGLAEVLTSLIGEPFRFSRVSYGDELTLHFGQLKPARSPRLKAKLYGSYILGLRGSSWVLKSGSEQMVVLSGVDPATATMEYGEPIENEALESEMIVESGSRVLSATPFIVKPSGGFGLDIRMSDGSSLRVLPAIPGPDEPEDEGLPELADWELSTPRGVLKAGPGLVWTFIPVADAAPDAKTPAIA